MDEWMIKNATASGGAAAPGGRRPTISALGPGYGPQTTYACTVTLSPLFSEVMTAWAS